MNRAVARHLAVASAATLVVGGLVAFVAPSASAAQMITVLPSNTSFHDDVSDERVVVGEVRNDGATTVQDITVTVQLLGAGNAVVGGGTAPALAVRLAPHEVSPFRAAFPEPGGFTGYGVTASADDSAIPANHNFTTTITGEPTDAFGLKHLVGSVRNDNTTEAGFAQVVFTFYDAANRVVNAGAEYVNDDAIAPGGSSSIDFVVDPTPSYSRYAFFAQSNSDAAPGASPSPSPSSSASPSPSPTASPAPDVTPTVTLGQSIISAGQRVVVTYHGAPNTTLQILSKTQPATVYSVISAVALDASGVGSTSHAPTKNNRIMARTAGGVSSLQPLIQVRSIASINAKRVGVRTYTFTGRVYPALNGRLVSLYRNGTLVAQGRTDASGIYTMTKLLAKGTFSFQVRTANDTYNLGTSSPAKTYTIS